jgi:hypothetical protein
MCCHIGFIKISKVVYCVFFSDLSSSETMQYNPNNIIEAPIHQSRFVVSLKTKAPKIAEMMKFDAVDTTVGTNVLESVE